MSNDVMDNVLAFASVIAPFILALVQLIKSTVPNIPKNFVPGLGLIVGLLVGAGAYIFTDLDLVTRLWAGGVAGLSATGLYELIFSDRKGVTKDSKTKQI